MKKLFLFAAALIMAVSFNACSKEETPGNSDNTENNEGGNDNNGGNNGGGTTSDVKLVKQIKYSQEDGDNVGIELEYDSQNRPVKVKMWGEEVTYSYNGNTMTVTDTDKYVMKLNADGFVTSFDFDGGNVSNTYNNGYVSRITTTWGKDEERYNDFVWNNGLLSSIETTYSDEHYLVKWSFTYDTNQTPTPINIDIIHMIFDPFGDDFSVSAFGFFGKQSRLYPVKADIVYSGGETAEVSIDYKFNADGTVSEITAHWNDSEDGPTLHSCKFIY